MKLFYVLCKSFFILFVTEIILDGISRSRQTYISVVFILCICLNLYLFAKETTLWDKRQPEERTRKQSLSKSQSEISGTVAVFNSTPNNLDKMQENLKLSLEISMKLSKMLADSVQTLPDMEKVLAELKVLTAKTVASNQVSEKTEKSGETLLTLFTSMDENDAARSLIHNNTIRNWSSLKPVVNPILFTNNETLKQIVEKYGWQTLPLKRTASNGMPILKYMYLSAIEFFKSDFYAFSNSDILFTGGLLKTLVTAKYSLNMSKPMLITGTRYNVQNVTDFEAKERSNLFKIAKARGELFLPWAADFFITTKSFPWKDIPEVVIGGLAFDNWLILYAREKKFLVIDVTKTAPAVHQTPVNGNFESHWKGTAGYNHELLAKVLNEQIDYQKGQVVCTEIVSSFESENVMFEKRAESMPYCYM